MHWQTKYPADLLESPGEFSTTVRKLSAGTRLAASDSVSDVITRFYFGGKWQLDPWIFTRTETGDSGWIYLSMILPEAADTAIWEQSILLRAYAGRETALQLDSLRRFRDQFSDLLLQYEKTLTERNILLNKLTEKVQFSEDPAERPDLFWVADWLPGTKAQLVDQVPGYAFPMDFGWWRLKADQSPTLLDDAFFDLACAVYPADSVESALPVWQFDTGNGTVHSMLGRGHHLEVLEKLALVANDDNSLAARLAQVWKAALLQDLTVNNSFWMDAPQALSELDQILAAPFTMLTQADRIALETRRAMLSKGDGSLRFGQRHE